LRLSQTKTVVKHRLCATIEHQEAIDVALFRARRNELSRIGAEGLLHAGIDWDDLFVSASPPGAPIAEVARASFTRVAFREHHERQRTLRRSAFVKAIVQGSSKGRRSFVRGAA
jgi:hypothetical protein